MYTKKYNCDLRSFTTRLASLIIQCLKSKNNISGGCVVPPLTNGSNLQSGSDLLVAGNNTNNFLRFKDLQHK